MIFGLGIMDWVGIVVRRGATVGCDKIKAGIGGDQEVTMGKGNVKRLFVEMQNHTQAML